MLCPMIGVLSALSFTWVVWCIHIRIIGMSITLQLPNQYFVHVMADIFQILQLPTSEQGTQ